jgi:hypothetical protein
MEHIIPYCMCLLVGVVDETKNGQIHCRIQGTQHYYLEASTIVYQWWLLLKVSSLMIAITHWLKCHEKEKLVEIFLTSLIQEYIIVSISVGYALGSRVNYLLSS